MSRIGKQPIKIPNGVKAEIDGQEIRVQGPKGELSLRIPPEIEAMIREDQIIIKIKQETKQSKAFWGLIRSLINNAVLGVSQGFKKQLEIQGVGYRAKMEGEELVIEAGFSHPVKIKKPKDIEFLVEKNIITVTGIDKQRVGQLAAEIRAVRPPEPYKGKGIRYLGEEVIRKAGKRAAEAAG